MWVPVLLVAQTTAFTHVNVVPMDRDTILRDHTVIVSEGRIVTVGPSHRVRPPTGAQIISGRGRYVLPGLTDFHTHLQTRRDMLSYVAHGVTTVVDLGSFVAERLLALRDSVRSGALTGPTIYTSLFVDGSKGVPSMMSSPLFGLAAVDTRSKRATRHSVPGRRDSISSRSTMPFPIAPSLRLSRKRERSACRLSDMAFDR